MLRARTIVIPLVVAAALGTSACGGLTTLTDPAGNTPTDTIDLPSKPSVAPPTPPPETRPQESSPQTEVPPSGSAPAPGSASAADDWYNRTYSGRDCDLGWGGPVTFVDGVATHPDRSTNSEITIERVSDAAAGNTLVEVHCTTGANTESREAWLVASDGKLVAAAEAPFRYVGGIEYLRQVTEGWEPKLAEYGWGSFSDVQLVELQTTADSVSFVPVEDPVPICAGVGDPHDAQLIGDAPVVTDQGELVRRFQQALIDAGYGAEVMASGGADGYFGVGTSAAFSDYLRGEYGGTPTDELPYYGGNDVGVAAIGPGWMDLLGVDCYHLDP